MNNFKDLGDLANSQNRHFTLKDQRVMCCLSGGVDSTALFGVLSELKKFKNIRELSICHVNFGLRNKESDLDETFLVDLAAKSKTPINVHKINKKANNFAAGESTQEWARRVRYEIFESYAEEGWIIALGHHQDDLAENILLRLSRGTSVIGMSGMSEWNSPYWRPFLSVEKSELIDWVQRHNLPHREDSSNAKMDYSRNVIRHKVLPELENLFPGAVSRIARVGNDSNTIAIFARDQAIRTLKNPEKSDFELDIESLGRLPNIIIKDLICNLLSAENDRRGLSKAPDNKFLELVLSKVLETAEKNKSVPSNNFGKEQSFKAITPDTETSTWTINSPGGGFLGIEKGILTCSRSSAERSKQAGVKHQFEYKCLLEPDAELKFMSSLTFLTFLTSFEGKNLKPKCLRVRTIDEKRHELKLFSPFGDYKYSSNSKCSSAELEKVQKAKNVGNAQKTENAPTRFAKFMKKEKIPLNRKFQWLGAKIDGKLGYWISNSRCKSINPRNAIKIDIY